MFIHFSCCIYTMKYILEWNSFKSYFYVLKGTNQAHSGGLGTEVLTLHTIWVPVLILASLHAIRLPTCGLGK